MSFERGNIKYDIVVEYCYIILYNILYNYFFIAPFYYYYYY